MWRKFVKLSCLAVGLSLTAPLALSDTSDPRVLTKAEFQEVAVDALRRVNGTSREEAAERFAEILDAARTYPGRGNLARKVRTGHSHYQRSKNIRKQHVASILEVFTTAEVAAMSEKEAAAVLSAWPEG